MNKVIAIDVDITIAASDRSWTKWLEKVTGVKLSTNPWDMDKCPYDIASLFSDELKKEGLTGYEYWDEPTLYDNFIHPVEGAVTACEQLSSMGYTLLPVSIVMGLHGRSKRRWLKRNFPMCEGAYLLGTDGNKSFVKCDYIIEDRIENLKGFTKPTKGIILSTPYIEPSAGVDISYQIESSWGSIVKYFEEEIKYRGYYYR